MHMQKIQEASEFISESLQLLPDIGLILGSGLGVLGDEITEPTVIPYETIPHFPQSTVAGHKGQLVIGKLKGKQVLAMQGRFHYYEGYSMQQVTFPVRVMKALGIETVIVTNAAGGINQTFQPGDLMVITDHINLIGTNPLIGPNEDSLGERFPDMTNAYDQQLIEHTINCAEALKIPLRQGVYVGNSGPTYETPAEVNMLKILGGDAVGMSTVPEVCVARHAGIRVLGISCISNMAAGILDEQLSHEDVIKTTSQVRNDFIKLVKEIIQTIP